MCSCSCPPKIENYIYWGKTRKTHQNAPPVFDVLGSLLHPPSKRLNTVFSILEIKAWGYRDHWRCLNFSFFSPVDTFGICRIWEPTQFLPDITRYPVDRWNSKWTHRTQKTTVVVLFFTINFNPGVYWVWVEPSCIHFEEAPPEILVTTSGKSLLLLLLRMVWFCLFFIAV